MSFVSGKLTCDIHNLTGALPEAWGWLENATYAGRREIHHRTLDLWVNTYKGAHVEVAVSPSDIHRPVAYRRVDARGDFNYLFNRFEEREPRPEVLVPRES